MVNLELGFIIRVNLLPRKIRKVVDTVGEICEAREKILDRGTLRLNGGVRIIVTL